MSDALEAEVRRVLLEAWDPVGVRYVPEAADEYDGYVPDVAGLVRDGADAAVLARHLEALQAEWMGLPPRDDEDRARIRAAAEALVALRP